MTSSLQDILSVSTGVPIAYPTSPDGSTRQVIGVNYFQVQNGKIVYMRTIHDSLPFQPLIDQRRRPTSRTFCQPPRLSESDVFLYVGYFRLYLWLNRKINRDFL